MSDDLKNFCRAVLKNIEREEEAQDEWFHVFLGLCFNSIEYDEIHKTRVYEELSLLFGEDTYPFNNDDSKSYIVEGNRGTVYKNEKRLAFLREHAL